MAPLLDLIIAGGTIVNESGRQTASIGVCDGEIVAIGDERDLPPATERIDAGGRLVLPGLIDAHVHFRDPGLEYKEDWATGSTAAAAGGCTTVLDMPNTIPPTATRAAFDQKLQHARERSTVDFGIYALLGHDNLDALEDLAGAGAIGYKLFLGNTTGNLPCPDDGVVLEGFERIAARGLRCTIHAENSPILFRREAALKRAGRTDALAHLAARPDVCAIEAFNRATIFAEWTGARIHIAHESTRLSLPFIRAAKARGVDVTVETCPQYLFLSTDDMRGPRAGILRVNPPIREPGHGEPLFDALLDGTIDIIATDHAPHTEEENVRDDIWDCSAGFPGVETSLRLMLTQVHHGRMTLEQLVRAMSAAPARAFGLVRKGALRVGYDADITIVDPEHRSTITATALHSRSRVTPYEGHQTIGAPRWTIVRGRVVMREGVVTALPGWGRLQRPTMPPPQPRNVERTTRAIVAAASVLGVRG